MFLLFLGCVCDGFPNPNACDYMGSLLFDSGSDFKWEGQMVWELDSDLYEARQSQVARDVVIHKFRNYEFRGSYLSSSHVVLSGC